MIFNEVLAAVIKALGCDPPLCHACGAELQLGDKVLPHKTEGLVVHAGCVDVTPLACPMDDETRAKVREAFDELAKLSLGQGRGPAELVADGWTSGVDTEGPAPVSLLIEAGVWAPDPGAGRLT